MASFIRNKIIQKIQDRNVRTVAIAMHNNPDGDAIGSAVALEKTLLKLGKKVDILINKRLSNLYSKIIGENRVNRIIMPSKKYDVLFLLDCADPNRTVDDLESYSNYIITIDHHCNTKPYGNIYLCEKEAATGVIIYKIIDKLVPFDEEISNALYFSIKSDTSNFKNANTNMMAHKIAGELLFRGANLQLINDVCDNKSLSMYKLMGTTFCNISFDKQYKIAYLIIRYENIKEANSTYEEATMLIDYLKNIQECEIAFLFLESRGNVKVKARSKHVNICEVMKRFDGGGHKNAAGAVLYSEDIYGVVEYVCNCTKEHLDKLRNS